MLRFFKCGLTPTSKPSQSTSKSSFALVPLKGKKKVKKDNTFYQFKTQKNDKAWSLSLK